MLAHRLRRWPNIEPSLGQRIVFAGMTCYCSVLQNQRVVSDYTLQVTRYCLLALHVSIPHNKNIINPISTVVAFITTWYLLNIVF